MKTQILVLSFIMICCLNAGAKPLARLSETASKTNIRNNEYTSYKWLADKSMCVPVNSQNEVVGEPVALKIKAIEKCGELRNYDNFDKALVSDLISDFSERGFKDTAIDVIEGTNLIEHDHDFTHSFDLTALYFINSRWDRESVLVEARAAANIFKQCNIRINLFLVSTYAPGGRNYTDMKERNDDRFTESLPPILPKPHIYYADKNTYCFKMPDGSCFTETAAYAYSYEHDKGEKAGTGWISYFANSDELAEITTTDPSTKHESSAHELGHILFEPEHVNFDNLMGNTGPRINDNLTKSQCQKIKESPLVFPIASNSD